MMDPQTSERMMDYVLGELDAAEARAFEGRMAVEPDLAREVAALRESLALLPSALPRVRPPADLKDRILERARASRPAQSGGQPVLLAPSDTQRDRERRTGPDGEERVEQGGRGVWPWLAAAALVLAMVGGGLYVQERGARSALAAELAEVESRLGVVLGESAELRIAAARMDSLLAVLASPDVVIATLSATDQLPTARLLWDPSRGVAVLAAVRLPPAPSGRTYQAWGIVTGQDPVSLGTFQPGADGRILVELSGPQGQAFELGAISEEPEGGSPGPTTTPILVGTLGA